MKIYKIIMFQKVKILRIRINKIMKIKKRKLKIIIAKIRINNQKIIMNKLKKLQIIF